jgi:hypothetical protein
MEHSLITMSLQSCDLLCAWHMQYGATSLHMAVVEGSVEAATLLLDKSAQQRCVLRLQEAGVTPLHLAAQRGHQDVVALLLSRGAQVDVTNEVSLSPAVYGHLHMAVWGSSHGPQLVDAEGCGGRWLEGLRALEQVHLGGYTLFGFSSELELHGWESCTARWNCYIAPHIILTSTTVSCCAELSKLCLANQVLGCYHRDSLRILSRPLTLK